MTAESPFLDLAPVGKRVTCGHVTLARDYGLPAAEYAAARDAVVLIDRSDRGRLRVTGADRTTWLHNLLTQNVQGCPPGAGGRAFALNVQGRIVFDVNLLVAAEAIWLDLPAAAVPIALGHLDRYLLTEDVQLADVSGGDARLALLGPGVAEAVAALGWADFATCADLTHREVEGGAIVFREDVGTLPGLGLIVRRDKARGWWDRLCGLGARPAGRDAWDALRIETRQPAWETDLQAGVLPAETGRFAAAVALDKGCYLGHEVVERMRSRGVQARRLVRLRVANGAGLALPAELVQGGRQVGRLTSLVRHPCGDGWLGLGYVQAQVSPGQVLAAEPVAREVCVETD